MLALQNRWSKFASCYFPDHLASKPASNNGPGAVFFCRGINQWAANSRPASSYWLNCIFSATEPREFILSTFQARLDGPYERGRHHDICQYSYLVSVLTNLNCRLPLHEIHMADNSLAIGFKTKPEAARRQLFLSKFQLWVCGLWK